MLSVNSILMAIMQCYIINNNYDDLDFNGYQDV